MKIEILPTAAEVARRGASRFEAAALARPELVMALPTGRTPIAMYAILAARRKAEAP